MLTRKPGTIACVQNRPGRAMPRQPFGHSTASTRKATRSVAGTSSQLTSAASAASRAAEAAGSGASRSVQRRIGAPPWGAGTVAMPTAGPSCSSLSSNWLPGTRRASIVPPSSVLNCAAFVDALTKRTRICVSGSHRSARASRSVRMRYSALPMVIVTRKPSTSAWSHASSPCERPRQPSGQVSLATVDEITGPRQRAEPAVEGGARGLEHPLLERGGGRRDVWRRGSS